MALPGLLDDTLATVAGVDWIVSGVELDNSVFPTDGGATVMAPGGAVAPVATIWGGLVAVAEPGCPGWVVDGAMDTRSGVAEGGGDTVAAPTAGVGVLVNAGGVSPSAGDCGTAVTEGGAAGGPDAGEGVAVSPLT
jgi:hypothetical protein